MARFSSVLAALALALPAQAFAQFHRATSPVMTPASVLLLQDDAAVLDLNPALLGLLPTWSLVYVHADVDQRDSWLGRGDAVSFATPLFLGFSLGVTLQSLRPGLLAASPPGGPVDRAMAGLGLAFAPNRRVGLGVSSRVWSSSDARIDGLTAVDVGLALRPSNRLGFSLAARDLFASREGFGTAGLDLTSSALVSAQLRPFGSSSFAIDGAVAFDARSRVGARAGLGLALPHVGHASAVFEAERIGDADEVLRALAELSLSLGGLTAGVGAVLGDQLAGNAGFYAMVRIEGQDRGGLTMRSSVIDLELSDLDARGMLETSMRIEAALHDPRVAGVLLRPRGSGLGSAYAQELRLLITSLRNAGKRVACHLEDASGSEYYACAAADAIFLDPAGNVRLLGVSSDVLLFGETLRKVGLRADFVRIGEYKSAPEQLTQGEMSEPAREQVRALLADTHHRVLADLAADLRTTPDRVAEIMDSGPHLAPDALRDGLIRRAVDEASARRGQERLWREGDVVDALPDRARTDWYAGPRIGIVVIDGAIVDGDNVDVPVLGVHMSGGRTIVRAIHSMVRDPLVRAIVVRVDSPGGAVLASDQIWRALEAARRVKPVVVSMGAVAASGGYYVASAGHEIWADPSTVTGSIGIYYGKIDVAELASTLGVGIELFRHGRRAGAESLWRPFTPEERQALAERLRAYYRLFLQRVAHGRGKTPDEIDAVARGRVYSGDAALRLGLVDHLGGLASAVARARQLAHVGDDAQVVVLPERRRGLLDFVMGGAQEASAAATIGGQLIPAELRAALGRILVMERLGATTPLALLPYDVAL